jgi:hypothetical protein
MGVMRKSDLEALFAALPKTEAIRVIRRKAVSSVDPELVAEFRKHCHAARLIIEQIYRDLRITPSWPTVLRETADAADAFTNMQHARDHYAHWTEFWLPGWPTPAQALAALALEANRQAEILAAVGDIDAASEAYVEGQAYLLELSANEADFRIGHAAMKKRGTEEARATHQYVARERQKDLVCAALSQLLREKVIRSDSSRKAIILALQHFWHGRDKELGFDPYEMDGQLRKFCKGDPVYVEDLAKATGSKAKW